MGCSGGKGEDYKSSGPTAGCAQGNEQEDRKQAKEDNKEFGNTMDFLRKVPLFKRLAQDQHPLLAGACIKTEFQNGQVIITQGDMGNEFFVIKNGEADVTVKSREDPQPKRVATLKAGDYFGENALLRDEPRTATVTASTALTTYKITRSQFQELGLHEKLHFANRKAVGGGGGRKVETKEPSPKTDAERKLIEEALKSNDNLKTMLTLDDTRVKQMVDVAWKETVQEGKEIIQEGDLNADYFYIVQDGSFEIYVLVSSDEDGAQPQSAEKAANRGESKYVGTVTSKGSFGELALLYLVPRAATVKAKSASTVWVIDRGSFKNILMKVSTQKNAEYVKYLDRVEILNSLLKEEKVAVAQALVEMHFSKGENILEQGDPGSTFYILYDGEVDVVANGTSKGTLKATPKDGTARFFGERALLSAQPRAATVKVTSNTAKALALDRDSFDSLLGPLEDIIKRAPDTTEASIKVGPGKSTNTNDKARTRILRKELERIGLLGCGGFGAVELYAHKVTGATYAMKGLSKGFILKTQMQASVMNEKNILLMTNSEFIIKLFECYNGSQTLYFLMEAALGGELYATYNRKGFHGSEKHAKFYSAGVVFAFEHMHERRIIYRDLKPENLLLNDKGQVKLTDMGLAKFVIGKTYTTCGTPDYFAPELIASTGHTIAVDWWTLGILIFEMMSGHPPFESAYPMQIYSKVMKGINKVPFPQKCQGPVGDLIKALLKKEPSERMPMLTNGSEKLREQKWYAGFDWEAMKDVTVEPPYKPVVKSPTDIQNFSARKEDMPRQLEYKDDGSGWDKDFAT